MVAPTLLRPRKHSVVELSLRGSGLFFLGLPPAAMPLSSSQPRRVPVQFCQTWACICPARCSGGTAAVRTDFFSRWHRVGLRESHSSTADYKTQRDRAVLLTSVTEITVSARHLPSQARASSLCCAAIAKCAPSLPPPRSFACCSGLRAAAVCVKTVRVFTDSLSAAA